MSKTKQTIQRLTILADERTANQILAVLELAVEEGEISEPFDVKREEVLA